MKKLTLLCSLTIGLLFLFSPVTAQQQEETTLPPYISFTQGEVLFGDGETAQQGYVIRNGDELTTEEGTVEVTLPEGAIFLEKNTCIAFSLGEKPTISLLKGKIYLTLKSEIEIKSNEQTLNPTEGLWQAATNQEGKIELTPREPYITETTVFTESDVKPAPEPTEEKPIEEIQTTKPETETEGSKIEECEEHHFHFPCGIHGEFFLLDFYVGFYPTWSWYYYRPYFYSSCMYYWSWYSPWYPFRVLDPWYSYYSNYYYSGRYGYNYRNNSAIYGRQTISSSQLRSTRSTRERITSVSSSRASLSSIKLRPSIKSVPSRISALNKFSSVSNRRISIQKTYASSPKISLGRKQSSLPRKSFSTLNTRYNSPLSTNSISRRSGSRSLSSRSNQQSNRSFGSVRSLRSSGSQRSFFRTPSYSRTAGSFHSSPSSRSSSYSRSSAAFRSSASPRSSISSRSTSSSHYSGAIRRK